MTRHALYARRDQRRRWTLIGVWDSRDDAVAAKLDAMRHIGHTLIVAVDGDPPRTQRADALFS